ncbi:MAG: oligopeptide/dipeptide ABC transporter ATP-binding protein [Bacilli bacterium]
MEKEYQYNQPILQVKDLRISFRNDQGRVHAVRGVNFTLNKGETLCIVGESGSGKSVTSKTIMGILPNNSIIESGEVIYEGEDLTKIDESEFHRIRGHKIGMIFQDPLSSLNPIMKVGKQITEAMLVNSDRMKIKFDSLISETESKYKNNHVKMISTISKANALVTESDRHFEHQISALQKVIAEKQFHLEEVMRANAENPDKAEAEKASILEDIKKTKADNEVKIAQIRKEQKAEHQRLSQQARKIKAEAKKEYKEKLPELKKALNIRKKEAKAEIAQFKKETKDQFDKDLAALEAQLNEIETTLGSEVSKLQKTALAADNQSASKQAYTDKLSEYTAKKKEAEEKIANLKKAYKAKFKITKAEAKEEAIKVMREVGIPQPEVRFKQYPFEFSGGMRQRIVIAIALTANPEVLICDEPTTALDVTIQAQILELINNLKRDRNMSVIFITHDLGVVANMADRVAVMYAGKIVEVGTANEIFYDPRHPYTWALLSSIPDIDSHETLEAIPGTPPYLLNPPKGDAFAARNKYALAIDFKEEPPYFSISKTHYAATWLLDKRAPKVEKPRIVTQRIKNSLERAGIKDVNEIK